VLHWLFEREFIKTLQYSFTFKKKVVHSTMISNEQFLSHEIAMSPLALVQYLARLALTDLIAATALPPPPPPSQPAAPKVEIKRSAEAPMVTAVWPAKEFSESRGTVQRSADDAGNISSNGNSSGGRALAWSTGDLNENVGDKAREGLGRERALMAGFDEVTHSTRPR